MAYLIERWNSVRHTHAICLKTGSGLTFGTTSHQPSKRELSDPSDTIIIVLGAHLSEEIH